MAAVKDSIVGLYITYFNRAPDSAGLAYWEAQAAANGATAALYDISRGFSQNAVAIANYPSSMTNTQFVTQMYNYALNRNPDAVGQSYWEGRVAAVGRAVTMVEFINATLDYVPNPSTPGNADAVNAQNMIKNKVAAGILFAGSDKSNVPLDASGNPDTLSAQYIASQDVMSGITHVQSTYDAAVTKVTNYASNLPVSAYSVFANQTSVNEGATATFKLNTTNVANGTVVNYTLSGTNITAADVVGGLSGSTTVNNNTATITVNLAADATTEGTEAIVVAITGQILGASSTTAITINDTSLSPAGQAFTLTTATDNPAATSGNETINGYFNTTTGAVDSTFNSADTINGNAGIDTFNLSLEGAANTQPTFAAANFSGIENIMLTNASANTATADLAGITEVQSLGSSNSATPVRFTNVGNAVNAALQNATSASAGLSIVYTNTALSGITDTSTLTLTNAGSAAVRPNVTLTTTTPVSNSLETLNIISNGTSNWITLATDTVQTSLRTLNISGAANVNIAFAAATDKLAMSATRINAATATGNVVIGGDGPGGVPLETADHHVTLGSGNDTVYICAHLNGNDTVAGGSGTDTLGVMQTVTNADMTNVSGMEIVRFDVTNSNITQDTSISSLANFNFAAIGYKTLTLNNLANNKTTTVMGGTTTLIETLKDGSGVSDVLTVELSNGPSNSASTLEELMNITGLETLNLVSSGGTATNRIINDFVTAPHVITGSSNLQISNPLVTNSVNAAAFTGNLTATGSAGNDSIILGIGADTINAGTGSDTVTLGAQGVNAASGADVITLGAGNDTLRFTGSSSVNGIAAASALYEGAAYITNFNVGLTSADTDFLSFSAHNADFSVSRSAVTYTGLAKGAIAQGLESGNTIVVQSVGQNAPSAPVSTEVSMIKLTTGTAFSSNLALTLQTALGTSSITGLAVNGNYLVTAYDTSAAKMIIAVVNAGSDATLSATDFSADDAIHVVGVAGGLAAGDYVNFGVNNLGMAF